MHRLLPFPLLPAGRIAGAAPAGGRLGGSLVAAMLAAFLAGAPARATDITDCHYGIGDPGDYHITQNLTCSSVGILISADNVTLHLDGHTLSGPGDTDCIVVFGHTGVRIVGPGTITGFDTGVSFGSGTTGSSVSGILFGNCANGISVDGSGNTVADNSTTQRCENAIAVGGSGNIISGNTLAGNDFGMFISGMGNQILNNTVKMNETGIDIGSGATGNTVMGNCVTANTTVDVADDNAGCDNNHWMSNTFGTAQVGGMAAGAGSCIGTSSPSGCTPTSGPSTSPPNKPPPATPPSNPTITSANSVSASQFSAGQYLGIGGHGFGNPPATPSTVLVDGYPIGYVNWTDVSISSAISLQFVQAHPLAPGPHTVQVVAGSQMSNTYTFQVVP